MAQQFVRSKKNKVIAGVCGGIGEYFHIDPTIIRLIIAVSVPFTAGATILAYILAIIVIPEDKNSSFGQSSFDGSYSAGARTTYEEDTFRTGFEHESKPRMFDSSRNRYVAGVALVLFGGLILLNQVIHISWHVVFPVLLILAGGFMLTRNRR